MGQLLGGDPLAGVLHRQHRIPSGGVQRQADGTAGRGVFHGVVQQDIHQLIQLLAVAGQGQAVLNVVFQRVSRLERHRLEPQCGVRHQIAEIQRRKGRGGPAALRPGEGQHILHQLLHPAGFRQNVVHIPLLLSAGRLLQQIGGGQDHRQGGFQLVTGVGDKLLLILPRPHHRAGDEAAQQPADSQQHQQRAQPDQQAHLH